jgi:hypothetical protein
MAKSFKEKFDMSVENEDHIRYLAGVHTTMTALELTIDEYGLPKVIDMLTDICHGKANHVREYGADPEAAKHWDSIAERLSKMGGSLTQTEAECSE